MLIEEAREKLMSARSDLTEVELLQLINSLPDYVLSGFEYDN